MNSITDALFGLHKIIYKGIIPQYIVAVKANLIVVFYITFRNEDDSECQNELIYNYIEDVNNIIKSS